jgi:hypothetical protein
MTLAAKWMASMWKSKGVGWAFLLCGLKFTCNAPASSGFLGGLLGPICILLGATLLSFTWMAARPEAEKTHDGAERLPTPPSC